jgi:superfamily II DNA/RNA helicase
MSITGELPPDERRARIDLLGKNEKRILVATDCLSEGINLQESFDAVVHYDLSWNPTRHQQREGRVDRFGQRSPEVRSVLMYGANNPVDGAVLQGAEALALLDQPTEGTPPEPVVRRLLEAAKTRLIEQRTNLDKHAAERARVLGKDHDRVRAAARASGASEVEAVTPVDVIGLYVLLPVEV